MNTFLRKYGLADWDILGFITFIIACLMMVPRFVITPQGTGADFGYMEALNWIWTHHLPLTFGKDIAYPYGPLGFLCYKVATNWQLTILILLFDIYIFINCALIIKAFMPVKSVFSSLVIIFTIFFFRKEATELVYYIIFLFSVCSFLKNKNYRYFINAVFISVLCFYIKLNLGLVQLFLLLVVIFYSFWFKNISKTNFTIISLAILASVVLLGYILNADIVQYVGTSLNIIGGYNEYVIIPVAFSNIKFQAECLLFITYNIVSLYYLLRGGFKLESVVLCFLTDIYIFIIFKYSFTRADVMHIDAFFVCTAAIGIQYLFESGAYKNMLKQLVLIYLVWSGIAFFILPRLTQTPGRPVQMSVAKQEARPTNTDMPSAQQTTAEKPVGLTGRFAFLPTISNKRLIPDSVLKKIGDATIDLMPYNLSLLFINQLNYCPRPTLQSVCAYTIYLDSLNYKKYMSPDGPEFVLYKCGTIDDRQPFWDESVTKRALCQNYEVLDSFYTDDSHVDGFKNSNPDFEKYLVLKKRAVPLVATVKNRQWGELRLNEPYCVDTGSLPQYMYAHLEYTMAGKLKSLLFQPTLIYAVITYQNGTTDSLRAVRSILETGVLINKKVDNTNDAEMLFRTDGAGNEKVKWIKFVAGDSFSFKPEIKFRTELIGYSGN